MRRLRDSLVLVLVMAVVACDEDDRTASEPPEVSERASAAPAACPEVPTPRTPLAQRLGKSVEKVAAACKAADPLARDAARDAEVAGLWKGEYQYDDGRTATEIEVTLRVRDRDLSGEMSEPNAFSTYGPPRLESAITGDVFASGQVVFMKTYSGSETHSVLYTGAIADGGRRIEGRWRLGGTSGPFWLAKS
jgi:hypothetical protein